MPHASYPANSVIACVDGSNQQPTVLEAASWAASQLVCSIGLLHAHDPARSQLKPESHCSTSSARQTPNQLVSSLNTGGISWSQPRYSLNQPAPLRTSPYTGIKA